VESGGKDNFFSEERITVVRISFQIYMTVIYLVILPEFQVLILNFELIKFNILKIKKSKQIYCSILFSLSQIDTS